MTWEETIQYIRSRPEYAELVEKAYFDENLVLNIERFKNSEEYLETIRLLKKYASFAKTILDIGSGNGITAVSFALDGFTVTAAEPDPSNTVGAGAIRTLKEHYRLTNLTVHESFAENIDFGDHRFDVIYIRQAMHHAYDLKKFISNLTGYLNQGGIILTVRDHVIYDEKDKEWFLETHPLQKYYNGENAFTVSEYKAAFEAAGLTIVKMLKHFDSVVNYFPMTTKVFTEMPRQKERQIRQSLKKKVSIFAYFPPLFNWYKKRYKFSRETFFDESVIPGRMYSFIAKKV